jgi:hypothetical protein
LFKNVRCEIDLVIRMIVGCSVQLAYNPRSCFYLLPLKCGVGLYFCPSGL